MRPHGKSIANVRVNTSLPSLVSFSFSAVRSRESFLLSLTDEEKNDPRFYPSHNLTESDRQLYFADFVIELQAAEDDKRRRIRDARRRAEKAQREAYRDVLKRLARDGTIRPFTRWRSIEEFVMADPAFNPVLAQDREAPREIYEEFIDDSTWCIADVGFHSWN